MSRKEVFLEVKGFQYFLKKVLYSKKIFEQEYKKSLTIVIYRYIKSHSLKKDMSKGDSNLLACGGGITEEFSCSKMRVPMLKLTNSQNFLAMEVASHIFEARNEVGIDSNLPLYMIMQDNREIPPSIDQRTSVNNLLNGFTVESVPPVIAVFSQAAVDNIDLLNISRTCEYSNTNIVLLDKSVPYSGANLSIPGKLEPSLKQLLTRVMGEPSSVFFEEGQDFFLFDDWELLTSLQKRLNRPPIFLEFLLFYSIIEQVQREVALTILSHNLRKNIKPQESLVEDRF